MTSEMQEYMRVSVFLIGMRMMRKRFSRFVRANIVGRAWRARRLLEDVQERVLTKLFLQHVAYDTGQS